MHHQSGRQGQGGNRKREPKGLNQFVFVQVQRLKKRDCRNHEDTRDPCNGAGGQPCQWRHPALVAWRERQAWREQGIHRVADQRDAQDNPRGHRVNADKKLRCRCRADDNAQHGRPEASQHRGQ